MDVHHIEQLLDAAFEAGVTFYREFELDLRETTEGPVRVALFETETAEFDLVVRGQRESAADELLDTVKLYSAALIAFEIPDLAGAMAEVKRLGPSFIGDRS